jgi:hypothetical protein
VASTGEAAESAVRLIFGCFDQPPESAQFLGAISWRFEEHGALWYAAAALSGRKKRETLVLRIVDSRVRQQRRLGAGYGADQWVCRGPKRCDIAGRRGNGDADSNRIDTFRRHE